VKSEPLTIPGLVLFTPHIHADSRGFVFESFNEHHFRNATGTDARFVQQNHSSSARGVLRGIHLQAFPRAQGKLIQVIRGAIFDVAVDARRHSPTFGKWCGVELSESNHQALWVPAGFGHGFISLSDNTEVQYHLTDYWQPGLERVVRWNDPDVGIKWPPAIQPLLTDRDAHAGGLSAIAESELTPI